VPPSGDAVAPANSDRLFWRTTMSNARGSKSARNAKSPAEGGAPEVALENGTTAVLPNPGDAPPPSKSGRRKAQRANEVGPASGEPTPPPKPAGRKRRTEPTVATKPDVPDWARRAAAHDTPSEMAAVSDAQPAAQPAPKRGRPARPKPAAKETSPAAVPGTLRAIGSAWIESLRADGHSVSTVASYGMDLEVAYEHLGADTVAAEITERQIAGFNVSKGVMKKRNGKPRAMPTILKTRRALRLALTWAEEMKLIPKAPYSAA
jgi:hypothetical protein